MPMAGLINYSATNYYGLVNDELTTVKLPWVGCNGHSSVANGALCSVNKSLRQGCRGTGWGIQVTTKMVTGSKHLPAIAPVLFKCFTSHCMHVGTPIVTG